MKATRYDKILETMHEDLKIDKVFLKDLCKFYWKQLAKDMINLKTYRLKIEGIGKITIRQGKLLEYRDQLLEKDNQEPTKTIRKYELSKEKKDKIKQIDDVLAAFDQEGLRLKQMCIDRFGQYIPNPEKEARFKRMLERKRFKEKILGPKKKEKKVYRTHD